ncbi:helix-turn-helix domain-containing protein [Variovorax sp. LjRoot290]|uniref:helix-turn-helix domain-containing protein n=1 Tax=Variovorax sp. LjRoot290 TaxID=3342316 RepID=UPI003F512122
MPVRLIEALRFSRASTPAQDRGAKHLRQLGLWLPHADYPAHRPQRPVHLRAGRRDRSFTAAAKQLGLNTSVASKAVVRLERDLGTGSTPTPIGARSWVSCFAHTGNRLGARNGCWLSVIPATPLHSWAAKQLPGRTAPRAISVLSFEPGSSTWMRP